jgi:hypothetical protein
MSVSDDYEDEMGLFDSHSDLELDSLFAEKMIPGDEGLEDIARHLRAVKRYAWAVPSEEVEARHVAAMVEAAQLPAEKADPVGRPVGTAAGPQRASGLPIWRRVMSLTVKLAAATIAASLSMVGLAFAGVDLPGTAAAEALEAVTGLELPNQGGDETELADDELDTDDLETADLDGPDAEAADVAQEIWNYISTTEDTGCVFGQNVAAIASGEDATTDTDPCTAGEDGAADGEATATDASSTGKATADENSTAGSARGEEKAAEDADNADDAGDANDAGDDAAEEGQSNNPSGKGRP